MSFRKSAAHPDSLVSRDVSPLNSPKFPVPKSPISKLFPLHFAAKEGKPKSAMHAARGINRVVDGVFGRLLSGDCRPRTCAVGKCARSASEIYGTSAGRVAIARGGRCQCHSDRKFSAGCRESPCHPSSTDCAAVESKRFLPGSVLMIAFCRFGTHPFTLPANHLPALIGW